MTASDERIRRWQHLEFGKLVQSAGGAIVPGSEHGWTGRSADFPQELVAECHPSKLGLGERDARRWAQCPWADVGGIVTGVGFVNSEPWVICGRVRERSEGGEGTDARLYTEAHYAAIPARDYEFDALRELVPHLHAEPRESVDLTLAPLTITSNGDDDTLPADWLTRARVILRGVMSGEPINIQDWDSRPEDFIRSVTHCLAAVPATLRWRLPLGAGLMTMSNATAVASGMSALGRLRIIEGDVKGEESLDLTLGAAYVEWLEHLTSGCATLTDVATAVRTELSGYSTVDAIEPRTPWPQAARAVATTITQLRMMDSILRSLRVKQSDTAVRDLVEFRPDLLVRLARETRGANAAGALTLLAQTVTEAWTDAWSAAVAEAVSPDRERLEELGMLLGALPLTDARRLVNVATIDLGADVADAVVQRLAAAVAGDAHGDAWLPLARLSANQSSEWVGRWREQAAAGLAWLGLRDVVGKTEKSALLAAMAAHPLSETALRLLRGDIAEESSVAMLLDLAALPGRREIAGPTEKQAVDALIAIARKKSAWHAFRLAELAFERGVVPLLWTVTQNGPRNPDEETVIKDLITRLVGEVAAGGRAIGPLMLPALLTRRTQFARSEGGRAVLQQLVERIGDPYATALFDSPARRTLGEDATAAEACAMAAITADATVAERLIESLDTFDDEGERRAVALLRHWVASPMRTGVGADDVPLVRALLALAGKGSATRLSLTRDERVWVRGAAAELKLPVEPMLKVAEDESLIDIVFQLWPAKPVMPLRVAQLGQILLAGASDVKRRVAWRERVISRRWEREAGWRWVSGQARECSDDELRALQMLDGRALLVLVFQGLPVPDTLVSRLRIGSVEEALAANTAESGEPKARQLGVLLRYASAARAESLITNVAILSLQLMREAGFKNKVDLIAEADSQSAISRAIAKLRAPESPIDLLRAVASALRMEPGELVDEYWAQAKERAARAK